MDTLRRLSKSVSNILTPSSMRSPTTMTVPVNASNLSLVDNLVARFLASELENLDIDLSQVVQSIEIIEEQTLRDVNGANEEESTNEQPRKRKPLQNDEKTLDIKGKYQEQLEQAKNLTELGWCNDTILAYLKIARRGYEPIFPQSWKHDFPKFPKILFDVDDDSAFIKPMRKSNFAAINAFDTFCMMGQSVRLAEHNHTYSGRSPENMIKKHLKDYLKWAWLDAGLTAEVEQGQIPCLITITKPSRRTAKESEQNPELFQVLEEKIKNKLVKKGQELLSLLQISEEQNGMTHFITEPPTLFGLVIYETLVSLVAYEPLTANLRIFAYYNFNKIQEEVWNTISLSLLVSWARNGMIRIKKELLARGDLMEVETPRKPDLDE